MALTLTLTNAKVSILYDSLALVQTSAIRLKMVTTLLYVTEAWHIKSPKRYKHDIKPMEYSFTHGDGTKPSSTILHIVYTEDLKQVLAAILAKNVELGTTDDTVITTDETLGDTVFLFSLTAKGTTYTWTLTRQHFHPSEYLYQLSA